MKIIIIILLFLILISIIISFIIFLKKMSGSPHTSPKLNINSDKVHSNIQGSNELILMTINLAHGRKDGKNQFLQSTDKIYNNLAVVAKVIKKYNPDIISLQEADAPSVWSGSFNHVEFLAKKIDYPYFIQGEHVKGMKLAYGTAIISKYFLNEPLSKTFDLSAPLFTKGFVSATINLGKDNEAVEIVSLHLDFARKSVRLKQGKQIVSTFKNRNNPLIIMGDFNSDVKSKKSVIRYIMNELDLKAYKPYDNSIVTFPFTNKRLDWILVSKRFDYLKHQLISEIISDHKSILVKIKLGGYPP
jgi:endonuclease/exonuclease/phosphatase family metal-dependent hydrolase